MSRQFFEENNAWSPVRTGKYAEDCATGRQYAADFAAALACGSDRAPLLPFIAQAQAAAGEWGGVEIGFWAGLQDAIAAGSH